MNVVSYLSPLRRRSNYLRDSERRTVSKNGATIAKAIFVKVCAWQWNIELILRVP